MSETTKQTRNRLPAIERVYDSPEALEAGKKDAIAKGHKTDVRKFKVDGGGKTLYVLHFTMANAVGVVYERLGVTVTELDPVVARRASAGSLDALAAKLAADTDGLQKLSPAAREALIAALTKAA